MPRVLPILDHQPLPLVSPGLLGLYPALVATRKHARINPNQVRYFTTQTTEVTMAFHSPITYQAKLFRLVIRLLPLPRFPVSLMGYYLPSAIAQQSPTTPTR